MAVVGKYKEREHLRLVAELGCIVCRIHLGEMDVPAEIHHLRTGVGMGQRSSHYRTIPLCMHHHRHGTKAIHGIGTKAWQSIFGSEEDLLKEVMSLMQGA